MHGGCVFVYHLSSEQHLVGPGAPETFPQEQRLLGKLVSDWGEAVVGCCRTRGTQGVSL